MAEWARIVEIGRGDGDSALRINGSEFPWYVSEDIEVVYDKDDHLCAKLLVFADVVVRE